MDHEISHVFLSDINVKFISSLLQRFLVVVSWVSNRYIIFTDEATL